MSKSNSPLNWKVFVTPAVATVSDDLPPGESARMWSPTSSVLIYGERDAILVDTLTTTAQPTALADWVDGLVSRPDNLKPAAVEKLAAALQSKGFVREIRAKPGAPIWRQDADGKTYSLKILKAGRDAIGVDDDVEDSSAVHPDPASAQGAAPAGARDRGDPEPPTASLRAGSKRALITALLQRSEGATLEDLIAATGWLPQTARAALSGLRKAGMIVDRTRGGRAQASGYRIKPESAEAA